MARRAGYRLLYIMPAVSSRGSSLGWARSEADANIDCWKLEFGRVESVDGVVCLFNSGTPARRSQPDRFLELHFPTQLGFFSFMDRYGGNKAHTEEYEAFFVANILEHVAANIRHQCSG